MSNRLRNNLHINNIKVNFVTNPLSVCSRNHNPQCPVSRALSTDKTKHSHSGSWIHYSARGNSFAKSQRASSSLINDIFLPALGSGSV